MIKRTLLHALRSVLKASPGRGKGFYSGKLSAKSKNVYNKSC